MPSVCVVPTMQPDGSPTVACILLVASCWLHCRAGKMCSALNEAPLLCLLYNLTCEPGS